MAMENLAELQDPTRQLDAEAQSFEHKSFVNSDGDSSLTGVTAILVNDDETIIPTHIVAEAIPLINSRGLQRCLAFGVMIVLAALALAAVRIICPRGLCGGQSDDRRTAGILRLINDVTLQTNELMYPTTSKRIPEEEAVTFLVENDALQLSAASDSPRLIQRYALTLLWFAIGPWTHTGDDARSQNEAKRAWFVGPEECLWAGVTCINGEVTEIHLTSSGAKGRLPLDLALLTCLSSLKLGNNRLTGTIPTFLSELSNLRVLDISSNDLTGVLFPSFFTELTSLAEFNVRSNKLSGFIPSNGWSNMTQLATLSVEANRLTGTVPNSLLSELTGLGHLGLGGNSLTGTLPQSLGELTHLEYLDVAEMGVSVASDADESLDFLRSLADLQKLTHLNLNQASALLDGSSLPREIGEWWPSMQEFSMSRTKLVGSIPASVIRWDRLTKFEVSNNELTGSLPQGIFAAWSELEILDVGRNELVGEGVPSGLGVGWRQLTQLDIRHNQFWGSLPTTLDQLSNLSKFVATGNYMTGEIPSVFSSSAMVWLDSNSFIGTAPFCAGRSHLVTQNRVDCSAVQCDCCASCL